jgi:hypothetical protein
LIGRLPVDSLASGIFRSAALLLLSFGEEELEGVEDPLASSGNS